MEVSLSSSTQGTRLSPSNPPRSTQFAAYLAPGAPADAATNMEIIGVARLQPGIILIRRRAITPGQLPGRPLAWTRQRPRQIVGL